ncbi:MAG: type I methionyl aminopeptidase [candidate division WOR-3 bacterium]
MIILKSRLEIKGIRRAAASARRVLDFVNPHIQPGITTKEIERLVHDFIVKEIGAVPTFLGYRGFPASCCISLNHEVVHGIPSEKVIIKEGDLVKLDVGVTIDGYVGDVADTFIVGKVKPQTELLVKATKEAFYKALEVMRPGNRLGDIGHAIQSYVEGFGFSPVRDLAGHGVGLHLHEEPLVPNYGTPGTGPELRPGMTLAVEPMINMGTWKVKTLEDGWTVITEDGKPSAHYEHDVLITDGEPEILSL